MHWSGEGSNQTMRPWFLSNDEGNNPIAEGNKIHSRLSKAGKATGHHKSKELDFHLNRLTHNKRRHWEEDVAAVAETVGHDLHLPHTEFHKTCGKELNFANHQVLQDQK